jgi:hypothetical protein
MANDSSGGWGAPSDGGQSRPRLEQQRGAAATISQPGSNSITENPTPAGLKNTALARRALVA